MFHFNNAFEDQVLFSLSLVHFERITPDSLPHPLEIISADAVSISEKSEDMVQMFIERKISFKPAGLFKITVKYEVVWKPKDWQLIAEANNDQIIQAMVEEKRDFLGNIASRTSLLISQLTASLGLPPMITPPEFDFKYA